MLSFRFSLAKRNFFSRRFQSVGLIADLHHSAAVKFARHVARNFPSRSIPILIRRLIVHMDEVNSPDLSRATCARCSTSDRGRPSGEIGADTRERGNGREEVFAFEKWLSSVRALIEIHSINKLPNTIRYLQVCRIRSREVVNARRRLFRPGGFFFFFWPKFWKRSARTWSR